MSANAPARILLVDDDRTLLLLFSSVLRREGYELDMASDGRTALAKQAAAPADLVLLDIHLPDMSGIDVMRQIVKTGDALVILITGDETSYSRAEAMQAGALDVIIKPIRVVELRLRISQALEARRLGQDPARKEANPGPAPNGGTLR